MELWVGCIAGALQEAEYARKLEAAGFVEVEVDPWRIYKVDDARTFLSASGVDENRLAPEIDGRFASAFIGARKPDMKSCCEPTCCHCRNSGSHRPAWSDAPEEPRDRGSRGWRAACRVWGRGRDHVARHRGADTGLPAGVPLLSGPL
jgi:hypothetical protein